MTALPVVYLVYFITYMFSGVNSPLLVEEQRSQLDIIFKLHLTVILLSWALIASYITYLFKTCHVPKDKKALWAVVIFLGSFVAMPIFWFLYVWKPFSQPAADSFST